MISTNVNGADRYSRVSSLSLWEAPLGGVSVEGHVDPELRARAGILMLPVDLISNAVFSNRRWVHQWVTGTLDNGRVFSVQFYKKTSHEADAVRRIWFDIFENENQACRFGERLSSASTNSCTRRRQGRVASGVDLERIITHVHTRFGQGDYNFLGNNCQHVAENVYERFARSSSAVETEPPFRAHRIAFSVGRPRPPENQGCLRGPGFDDGCAIL